MKDIRLLGDILKHKLAGYKVPVRSYLVLENTLVLIICAKLTFQLPFFEAVCSLQPLTVVLIGAVYGYQASFRSVLFYFALGMMGLPVFEGAETGVEAIFNTHTLGYYLSFVPAIFITASLATFGWDRKPLHGAAMILLSICTVYLLGIGLPYLLAAETGFLSSVYGHIPAMALQILLGVLLLQVAWAFAYEAYPELKEKA